VLAIVGSAVFLVIAPGFIAGLVPWWISRWRLESPFFGMALLRLAGGILVVLGGIGLLDSFVRFAVQGVGTPAPVFPTRHLVVTGLYRYVRNPMYVAVVSTILGQGVILGNVTLLEWRTCLAAVSPLRVGLRRTNTKGQLWLRVRTFLHPSPKVDSTFHTMEKSFPRVRGRHKEARGSLGL
jgi:protein-S-isoprenylcysteine O-methyltransferase Ste14